MRPAIYAIGEKKPEIIFFRLLFPNCINWWAHGEDRAIACFSPPCKIISLFFNLICVSIFTGDEQAPKKTATKAKKKSDKKPKASIFDDDVPSIFDDPLNATSK